MRRDTSCKKSDLFPVESVRAAANLTHRITMVSHLKRGDFCAPSSFRLCDRVPRWAKDLCHIKRFITKSLVKVVHGANDKHERK